MSEERKRQIYVVAQEYNLLIIEDDPYYLLQYRDGKEYRRESSRSDLCVHLSGQPLHLFTRLSLHKLCFPSQERYPACRIWAAASYPSTRMDASCGSTALPRRVPR